MELDDVLSQQEQHALSSVPVTERESLCKAAEELLYTHNESAMSNSLAGLQQHNPSDHPRFSIPPKSRAEVSVSHYHRWHRIVTEVVE